MVLITSLLTFTGWYCVAVHIKPFRTPMWHHFYGLVYSLPWLGLWQYTDVSSINHQLQSPLPQSTPVSTPPRFAPIFTPIWLLSGFDSIWDVYNSIRWTTSLTSNCVNPCWSHFRHQYSGMIYCCVIICVTQRHAWHISIIFLYRSDVFFSDL